MLNYSCLDRDRETNIVKKPFELFPPVELRPCKVLPQCKLVRIRIISGQHLPKSEQRLKGDIIEPYVKLRVRGHPEDEAEYVTKVIPKVKTEPLFFPWNFLFLSKSINLKYSMG